MQIVLDSSKKNVIGKVTENYEKLFEALNPTLFKYNNEPSDTRIHVGLVAEDMLSAMESLGFDKNNFCPYVDDIENVDEDTYQEITGVSTTELIVLNTYMIQRCIQRITELENEVAELKKANV